MFFSFAADETETGSVFTNYTRDQSLSFSQRMCFESNNNDLNVTTNRNGLADQKFRYFKILITIEKSEK